MLEIRTIKVLLNIPISDILPTIQAYTKAYNLVCQTGWNDKDFNGVSLHHKTYKATRKYLPANLAISARVKATETLLSIKTKLKKKQKVSCPQSKQCSIRYNSRTFNFWLSKNQISLLTIKGQSAQRES